MHLNFFELFESFVIKSNECVSFTQIVDGMDVASGYWRLYSIYCVFFFFELRIDQLIE